MNLSKVIRTARTEYVKWLLDEKQIVTVVCLIFLHVIVVSPFLERAEDVGTYLNVAEPFIAVANSRVFLLVLPLVFLVLILDCPRMDGNLLFSLARAGKKNWVTGQFLFLVQAALSYLGVILLYTLTVGGINGYVGNAWSLVVSRFHELFGGEAVEYISLELYWQMPPYEACVKSCVLLFGYFVLVGTLLLVFTVYDKKKTGIIVTVGILGAGTATASLDLPQAWCFPTIHAILGKHFQGMERQVRMDFWGSVIYDIAMIAVLFVIAYTGMKKKAVITVDSTEG